MLKSEVRHEYYGENFFTVEITNDSRTPRTLVAGACLTEDEARDLFDKLGHALCAKEVCGMCDGKGSCETVGGCPACHGEGQCPM